MDATLPDHGYWTLNRYWHRFDDCETCLVGPGDICLDLRTPSMSRKLKPHPGRPLLPGVPPRGPIPGYGPDEA
jgi:hypothetical protein